ncbi:hypothetical protein EYF80_041528 [Liparis tanakae]|uniref:Uncharacterized protein n=1 Tax=Liparis tanakae TaxID=230148 RepID=A0A4Z2G3Z8_9TELE|nr:hypothetical protein EYF80_041528 [Liparis tanakae]
MSALPRARRTASQRPYSQGSGPRSATPVPGGVCELWAHDAMCTLAPSSPCRIEANEHAAEMWAERSDEHTSNTGSWTQSQPGDNRKEPTCRSALGEAPDQNAEQRGDNQEHRRCHGNQAPSECFGTGPLRGGRDADVAHGENDRLVLEHVRALTVVAEWTRPTGEHPLPRRTHSWAENAAGTEEERYRYTLLRPGPRVTSHEDMSGGVEDRRAELLFPAPPAEGGREPQVRDGEESDSGHGRIDLENDNVHIDTPLRIKGAPVLNALLRLAVMGGGGAFAVHAAPYFR